MSIDGSGCARECDTAAAGAQRLDQHIAIILRIQDQAGIARGGGAGDVDRRSGGAGAGRGDGVVGRDAPGELDTVRGVAFAHNFDRTGAAVDGKTPLTQDARIIGARCQPCATTHEDVTATRRQGDAQSTCQTASTDRNAAHLVGVDHAPVGITVGNAVAVGVQTTGQHNAPAVGGDAHAVAQANLVVDRRIGPVGGVGPHNDIAAVGGDIGSGVVEPDETRALEQDMRIGRGGAQGPVDPELFAINGNGTCNANGAVDGDTGITGAI